MADFAYAGADKFSVYGPGGLDTWSSSVTAGAPSNTKGAYTQLTASTTEDAVGLILSFGSEYATVYGLLDIAIGAAGSEQVIIPNVPFYVSALGCVVVGYFPVKIPAGSRLSARWQGGSGQVARVSVVTVAGMFSSPVAFSGVENLGANLSTSRGTDIASSAAAVGVKTAYAQLTASTVHDTKAAMLCFDHSCTYSSIVMNVDVAIGAAGSEQVIIPNICTASYGSGRTNTMWVGPLPLRIPAGSRVSFRVSSSISNASDVVGLLILGFY